LYLRIVRRMKSGEKEKVYADQLVLKSDLEIFKKELLAEFRVIVRDLSRPRQKKWLKSVEVKKKLNISHGKLQTMRNTGAITFTKIGGSLYYDEEDIERMFEKYKIKDR